VKDSSRSLPPERIRLFGQVGHENVKGAVAVDVTQRHAHAGLCLAQGVIGQAANHRFFFEGAVVLVDPKSIRLSVVSDKDVGPAVAVEVGADDPETRAGYLAQSRL